VSSTGTSNTAASIEGISTIVVPSPNGTNEVRVTWKNTGSTNIHGVKADIELLDTQGSVIEKINNYWIYAADGWGLPGETPAANASPGIAPGFTYTDPAGQGYQLIANGSGIVPSNARVTALYVVQ